jgi:2Fe-2S ferredoxin
MFSMAQIRVSGCEKGDHERVLNAPAARPLMEVLRDAETGILGICGGECMCGTCHVYVDPAWLDKLPPKSEEEQMMLEAIGDIVEVRPNSRLSCQIPISDTLEGMPVEVGPVP